MNSKASRCTMTECNGKAKHPLPWYTPRFWHGMTMSTWVRELRRNRFALSPSRLPMGLSITGLAAFNSLLAALERTLEAHSPPASLKSPLFVLGHWRSGTTFLHELLICDPRHSFANTYQCFTPHHFPLTERWLVPMIRKLLPKQRPMDNMAAGWGRPMEDEFALQNLGVPTPYLSTMFPNRGEAYADYLTLRELSPRQRQQWKYALLSFCERLARFDGRRLVLKSPPHTARIRTLLELFPDARFIHVAREPHAMFRSSLDLWRTLNCEVGLQVVQHDDWLESHVLQTLRRMYEAYFEDRRLLSSNQLVELKYEDLVRDPLPQLRNTYERLGFADFAFAEPDFKRHLEDIEDYQRNAHRADDRWTSVVDEEWALYSKNFGYDAACPRHHAAA
jgi:hypothetical protein